MLWHAYSLTGLHGGVRALGGFGRGGGGLAHFLVRLFIWHAIWRFALLIWRIPKVGPVILVVIIAVLIAGSIFLSRRRRAGFPGRRFSGGPSDRGPRDW
jgi:hypothetical protein